MSKDYRSRRVQKTDGRHRLRSPSSSSSYSTISSESSTERYSREKRKKKHRSKSYERRDGLRFRPRSSSSHNPKGFGSTKSRDPKMIASRIFIGNLPDENVTKDDLLSLFDKYGKIIGITVLQGFAFIQYEDEESAINASKAGAIKLNDAILDVKCHTDNKRKNVQQEEKSAPVSAAPAAPAVVASSNTITIDLTQPPPSEIQPPRPQLSLEAYYPAGPPPMMHQPPPGAFYRPPMPHPFYRERFPRDPFLREPFIRDPYIRESFPPPMDHMLMHPMHPPPRTALPNIAESYTPLIPAPVGPPLIHQSSDCQIIVVDEAQRGYAVSVKKRLLSCGLSADIMGMRAGEDTSRCVDEVKRNRIPFAVIVNEQNQLRKSITVNILHGSPQEHRNMPLEDAIVLISRSFDKYVLERKKEDKSSKLDFLPPTKTISYIMSLIMEEKFVKADELDLVIDYLIERRDQLLESEGQTSKRKKVTRSRSPDQSDASEAKLERTSEFEMQLLKMLRSEKAASAAAATKSVPVPEPVPPVAKPASKLSTKINMDDPDIKKALDNLISTGPNLLKNISQINSSNSQQVGSAASTDNKWDGYQY